MRPNNNLRPRHLQKETGDALQTLSTVATFLSGVTATMLQLTYQNSTTHLDVAVNMLWLTSLILSLGCAINSQLAYRWKAATFHSTTSNISLWITEYANTFPVMWLGASVLAFSVGVILFAFDTFPDTMIPKLTTALTSFFIVALLLVGLWFVGEQTLFHFERGQAPLLHHTIRWFAATSGMIIAFLAKVSAWCRKNILRIQAVATTAAAQISTSAQNRQIGMCISVTMAWLPINLPLASR